MAERTVDRPGVERRGSRRVKVARQVVFGESHAEGMPRDGTLADISRDGLRLLAAKAMPAQSEIYVDIPSTTTGDAITRAVEVRGRVVRVQPEAAGWFSMGVRLNLTPKLRHGKTLLKDTHDKRTAPDAGCSRHDLAATEDTDAARISRHTPNDMQRSTCRDGVRRRALGAAVVTVGLCLVILLLLSPGMAPVDARGAKGLDDEKSVQDNGPAPVGFVLWAGPGVPASPAFFHAALLRRLHEAEDLALHAKSVGVAENTRPRARARRRGRATTQASSEGAEAEGTVGGGRVRLERDVARVARAANSIPMRAGSASEAPEETRQESPLGDIASPAAVRAGIARRQRAVARETAAHTLPVAVTDPARVRIEVDKSDFEMKVLVDGEPVAEFSVGLGEDDSTPEGDFAIVNKAIDPDWNDRGRIVKAGDPGNPLGRYWMGLGNAGRATPYGIHPTDEPDSIGASRSRGCIRMRPEEAAVVFELCPVGTAVTICR